VVAALGPGDAAQRVRARRPGRVAALAALRDHLVAGEAGPVEVAEMEVGQGDDVPQAVEHLDDARRLGLGEQPVDLDQHARGLAGLAARRELVRGLVEVRPVAQGVRAVAIGRAATQ
jgi:hypothetical protein